MTTVRILGPGDEDVLQAFLRTRNDTTMFMQSNLAQAGIEDRGERFHVTYAGVFEGEDLVGALGHAWNGLLLVEAREGLIDAIDAVLRASERGVKGFSGPLDQVQAARSYLCLDDAEATLDSDEVLYAMDLQALRVPLRLADGSVTARRATEDDLSVLLPWGADYNIEAVHATPGPALDATVRESMESGLAQRTVWIAFDGDEPVAMTRFNAITPHAVQVGGVYTPPELRSRGHAGCAVAQSLLDARGEGVERSILFTEEDNTPARRCYYGLGYEPIGAFGIVLLRESHRIRPG